MTPEFRPRFPWWGGDLQTLRNRLAYKARPLPGRAKPFEVTVPDGDRLTGTLHLPSSPRPQPLIFLLHGLTGDEDSMYMLESARYHVAAGRAVLRMNLRGAGSSRLTCKGMYSGMSGPDVHKVLNALDPSLTDDGVFIIGYSMGGNILLNALPDLPVGTRCIGAASVSAPINPVSASRRLMDWRNRVYQNALLDGLKETHLAQLAADDLILRKAIESADSIWDFDDRVTGPRVGFSGARAYYQNTAGINRINAIRVPLLLIHARNDPWIPVAPYLSLSPPENVTVEITGSGGHVGFHGRGHFQPWHDLRIGEFVDALQARDRGHNLRTRSDDRR